MIILCRMATAVADWAHARAAREYARTLLTGPHCCATTSFDHASPTSHRAQRECPATQIARHGCRQHAWAVRAHRDTVILTQHNTSFQGHQFLAKSVPHGQPGMRWQPIVAPTYKAPSSELGYSDPLYNGTGMTIDNETRAHVGHIPYDEVPGCTR